MKPGTEPRLADIASYRELREQIEYMRSFRSLLRWGGPLLKLLGADVEKMKAALSNLPELEVEANELLSLPDRFNDTFSPLGWVLYDSFTTTVAAEALKQAEDVSIEAGEQVLLDHYTAGEIAKTLPRMMGVRAFRPRMPLVEKALEDYRAERYHACVPILLMMIDGLVADLSEQQTGFFAEGTDLTAWDSIVAHEQGLGRLVGLFRKGRRKTNVDRITVPYRHGILHGRDLGFDNQFVAAKCWAALFAVRDWAIKAERGETGAPPKEPEPTWSELLKQIARNQEVREALGRWEPRVVAVGRDVPASGASTDYSAGTPERRVVEFLELWRQRNYGRMLDCIAPLVAPKEKGAARQVKDAYRDKELRNYQILSIEDQASAISVVTCAITYVQSGAVIETEWPFRLVGSGADGELISTRGLPNHEWGVIYWRVE